MSIRAWLSPSRHLLALFIAVTLVPAVGLVWLGWRLLEQDRALEVQRATERRELAADRIVNTLQQEITSIRQTLADPSQLSEPSAGDSVVVVFRSGEVEILPPNRLLYQPTIPAAPEPPAEAYQPGEGYEFQQQDYARAINAFRRLTRSDDPAVCAGAYLRIARNHRKAGNVELALAAYESLAAFSNVRFQGVPGDLVARRARCTLLAELGHAESLKREARALWDDLFGGRWKLTQPVFQLHADQAHEWVGLVEPCGEARVALSAAVEWLWKQWQNSQAGSSPLPNAMTYTEDATAFTILSQSSGDSLVALVAGPALVEKRWISSVTPFLETQALEVYLRDSSGNAVRGTAPAELARLSLRLPADTGLPWTVVVGDRNGSSETARFASRRRLLLSGMALVAVLFVASSYFIGRAFSRELSLARLKSDFVSAVSHEFRTPLATLHQLTENLAEGRVTGEERRLAYYEAQVRATGRLTRLVERLLDFGRMEAGAFRYRLEPVPLDEIVRSVVDEFEHLVSTTGHRIDLSIDPDLEPVRVDKEAMAQAIWNLLDNAIKYSPDDSTVWIEVARKDRFAAIRVRDEGTGIADEEQKEIFRKFVRGSAARESAVKGTGIGLAMVDYIIRAHKGRVQVDSRPGQGSTFTILLRMEEA